LSEPLSHTENNLFRLIAEGDEQAFKDLYQLLHPILRGYISKILQSEQDVTEILQESLLRLWLNREKLADLEYPRTWFFRIVTNECYRYFRKNGLRHRLSLDLQQANVKEPSSNITDLELSYRETQQIIQLAVRTLSPRRQEIYRLSRDRGLKIPEIAELLNLTPKYVKKALIIALKVIRQRLIKAGKFTVFVFLCFFI
jgi:RNA polymerase sigma-70 factor (ECF subfamily)